MLQRLLEVGGPWWLKCTVLLQSWENWLFSPHHISTGTRLAIKFLQTLLCIYYSDSISPATKTTYSPSQTSYLKFCSMIQYTSIPANESTILLFVTYLATSGLSYTTINMYHSAIHSMPVATGQHIVFNQQLTPRLQQVLHDYDEPKPPQIRRPITLDIMKAILNLLLKKSAS